MYTIDIQLIGVGVHLSLWISGFAVLRENLSTLLSNLEIGKYIKIIMANLLVRVFFFLMNQH